MPSSDDRSQARLTLTRRAVLIGAPAAALGAAACLRSNPAPAPLAVLKDHRVALAAGANQMAIVHGVDAAANARKAVEALGGMAAFVRPGEKVLIKPNIGWNRTPEQAANTNPELVAELVRMAKAAGATTVWVADNPVHPADKSFERSGIRKAAGEAGATVVLPAPDAWRGIDGGGKIVRATQTLFPYVDADKIINVPIAKHHELSGATLALKNWFGAVGGDRSKLHEEIDQSIVELATMVKPTLTVMDATRVLVANGPTGGNLDDVKKLDLVAASMDQVALDAWALTLLGIKAEEAPFVALAQKAGLGTADFKSLKTATFEG